MSKEKDDIANSTTADRLASLGGRVERLERLLADLADEVGTGSTGHIRTASQNRALGVLRELRPVQEQAAVEVSPSTICGRVQDKDDEDSAVCLEPKDHKTGHRYGVKPAVA